MVKYQLICENSHEFEGWFPSSESFSQQAEAGHVVCPHCASISVRRALMAPNLVTPKTRKRAVEKLQSEVNSTAQEIAAKTGPEGQPDAVSKPASTAQPAAAPAQAAMLPQQMMMALRQMHQQVKENCKPVGDKFADEARKMHKGEAPKEAIYGTCTDQEKEELADEGIDFAELPDLPADQ